MTEFVSDVKTIRHDSAIIFPVLSDFSKLELIKDKIPEDKISDISFDKDRCSFKVNPIGDVAFVIEEREPNKTIKFKSENLPFPIYMWIQLIEKDKDDTKMKITVRADLNPYIKPMVSKPLSEAVEKIADILTKLPYNEIA